ncbi:MAG: rhodanese-like domain-containing protein [bacterium]|nr:rhodanese-like domain-containing protein [bacterium]
MDMHFEGVIFHTHADELERRLGHDFPPFAVLDVRPQTDHARRRIRGSISIDADHLEQLPEGTDMATEFFVVGTGHADAAVRRAALALKGIGARRVVEVTGGYYEWRRRGLPEETGQTAA